MFLGFIAKKIVRKSKQNVSFGQFIARFLRILENLFVWSPRLNP